MPSPRWTTDDHLPRQLWPEVSTTLDLEAAGDGGATRPRFRVIAYTDTPKQVERTGHPLSQETAA